GLRVSELTGVRWRDLDLREGLVRVTGKGSKTRIVPVGGKALAALATLRAQDHPHEDDALVHGRLGKPLTPNGVARPPRGARARPGRLEARLPAPAAPFVRQPPARIVGRPARRAGDARPRRHCDDADLYAPRFPAPRARLRRGPPAREASREVAGARHERAR